MDIYSDESLQVTATMIAGFVAKESGTYMCMPVSPGLSPKFETGLRLAPFAKVKLNTK